MQTIQPPLISHRLRDSDSKQPLNILTHHYRDDVLSLYFKDVKNRRGVSEEMLQVPIGRAQFFLNASALGNVANEPSEHRRILRANPNDREFHRKLRAIAPHRRQLDLFTQETAIARGKITGQAALVPFAQRRWNNYFRQELANRFLAPIAKRFFRRGIELNDSALMVHRDNAVKTRFQNRLYPLASALAF